MQPNATKSKSVLGWSRQRPKFRTRRFHRILALALVAANVLGAGADTATAATRHGGPGPDMERVDTAEVVDRSCWNRALEPQLFFDGECRDHEWLMNTLGDRTDREVFEVLAPKAEEGGTTIIIYERDLYAGGVLHITALTSEALRPMGPTRAGYATLAIWTIDTAWEPDYANYVQRQTVDVIDRHEPVGRWGLGTWSTRRTFERESSLTPEAYSSYSSSSAATVDRRTRCAIKARRVGAEAYVQCIPNMNDYLAGTSFVAATGLSLGSKAYGIWYYSPASFGRKALAKSGAKVAFGSVAKVVVGAVVAGASATGATIAWYDQNEDRGCRALSELAFAVAEEQCIEDLDDDEEPTGGPDERPDGPDDTFDFEFGCGGMQIQQQVTEVREVCHCNDVSYTQPSSDPEFEEEMVVSMEMVCEIKSNTSMQCCDPHIQDCSPAEVDLGSNAETLACY
ncbi:MAG: hypothetical protein P8K76_13100 [Candidatus Binatia bacterium]|nr:hypothetical protein [Candidatus Binatia bacterium]